MFVKLHYLIFFAFRPGSIIANYSVSFNSVTVSKDTGVIVDYIATSVAASLLSSEINGSSLNPGDMATVATNQRKYRFYTIVFRNSASPLSYHLNYSTNWDNKKEF